MLYTKSFSAQNQNDSLSLLYGFVAPGSLVLDVGCACGDLAAALHREKNCVVCGLEKNPESVALCRRLNVFRQIDQFDLNNLTTAGFSDYIGTFDTVICGDVLEHLIAPDRTLQVLRGFLKKKGQLLVSLPNVAHASIKANLLLNDFTYTDIGILDRTHLHFFTARSIASFLAKCGFAIETAAAVTLPPDGWQPHPLSDLPPEIASFILADRQSYIMQYVMRCCLCSADSTVANLKKLKNLSLDKNERADIISRIKRLLVTRWPDLLKYLEKLRLRR